MHFTKKTASEKRSDLAKALKSKKLLRFPGAYNPLCAKLITEIGFDGVYISGGVMSNDLGLPDIGLTTLDQVSYRSNQIARVTDLPTIVDIDTGFGNCKNTIQVFEKKGLAGCHLEDQIAEKRCGHLDNKELVSKEKMVEKIRESKEAIYKRVFCSEEVRFIKSAEDFTNLWTRKEAVVKLFGGGLSMGLNSFSVLSDEFDVFGKRVKLEPVIIDGFIAHSAVYA